MNKTKTFKSNLITLAMVLIVYAVIQILISTNNISPLLKSMLIPTCSYIIGALSLNLTVGILGELSLGHGGFMSVGAFTAMLVNSVLSMNDVNPVIRIIVAVIAGAIFASIFGLIVGLPVLRLHGDYLAIVTLAFGQIWSAIVTNLYIGYDAKGLHFALVNNDISLLEGGKMIINGPMGAYNTKCATFTLGFILIFITLIVIFNLVNSKTGRAIMAFRDNRIAAESVGVNVSNYKLMTFMISAFIAGIAGALFGLNSSTLSGVKFDYNTSILILVFVVLGGLGNMRGTIIATSLLNVLPELLRELRDYRMIIYAVLLIVIMIATNSPQVARFLYFIKRKLTNLFKSKKKEVAAND